MTLIERIETAETGSRELDVAIFRIVKPEYAGDEWQPYGTGMRHRNDSSDARCMPPIEATVPRYTASIDAALTLLPEGAEWSLAKAAYGKSFACIDSGDDRVEDFKAYAKTPALALLSAILKARGVK